MLGILSALGALVSWGFGDFFIQRTVRKVGVIETLFFIDGIGTIALLPFVWNKLGALISEPINLLIFVATGFLIFFVAIAELEAFKRGKLSIVEPILGVELPLTVALSIFFLHEKLSLPQLLLVTSTFVGVVLSVTIHFSHLHYHRRIFEKGVPIAILGMAGMALVNFLIGVESRATSALMAIWATNVGTVLLCIAYLAFRREFPRTLKHFAAHSALIIKTSVIDNAAWLFYAFAATVIPIAVAVTVSEAYIALAALLGIFINRERLKPHQLAGVALAIGSVILLSAITGQ